MPIRIGRRWVWPYWRAGCCMRAEACLIQTSPHKRPVPSYLKCNNFPNKNKTHHLQSFGTIQSFRRRFLLNRNKTFQRLHCLLCFTVQNDRSFQKEHINARNCYLQFVPLQCQSRIHNLYFFFEYLKSFELFQVCCSSYLKD